jgi:long-chain acyl-CoA synthetase
MEYTQNFVQLYEKSLSDNFNLPALSDYGTEIIFTYGDIAKEIAVIHLLFDAYGIQKGEKVALIGKNSSYWGVVFLAVVSYGAVAVPILHDFSSGDIQHIINHSEAALLFSTDSILEKLNITDLSCIKAAFSFSGNRLSLYPNKEQTNDPVGLAREKFSQKYPDGFTANDIVYPEISNENVVILNYTSGTTGFSKGVLMTGRNLAGNLMYARYTMKLKTKDVMLSLLPLAHAYGCSFEFLYPLQEGCHVIFLGKTPHPTILMQAFKVVKPNLIITVPLILEKIYKKIIFPEINKKTIKLLLKIPGINTLIYTSIRKKLIETFGGNFIQLIIGGAPLNNEVEDFMLKIKFPLSNGYGMTECAPLISFSLYTDYIAHSCGKVLPCISVRIDSSDSSTVAGEIQVTGQNVMKGYYKNEEATRNAFTADGWLKTGDLGTIDKNNNLFIRGRLKNVILSASGQNIYPEEMEAKLNNLPFIAESLVVGKGGKLIALVYPDYPTMEESGFSTDDLEKIMDENKKALNASVAGYEKIAEIQVMSAEFEKTPKKSIKRYLYEQ